jgi:hypothetical protein
VQWAVVPPEPLGKDNRSTLSTQLSLLQLYLKVWPETSDVPGSGLGIQGAEHRLDHQPNISVVE